MDLLGGQTRTFNQTALERRLNNCLFCIEHSVYLMYGMFVVKYNLPQTDICLCECPPVLRIDNSR